MGKVRVFKEPVKSVNLTSFNVVEIFTISGAI
jgi:hypothetical protein